MKAKAILFVANCFGALLFDIAVGQLVFVLFLLFGALTGCADQSLTLDTSFTGDADTGYYWGATGCRVIVDGVDVAPCELVWNNMVDDAAPFCPVLGGKQ